MALLLMFNTIQRNIPTVHSEAFMQRLISGTIQNFWAVRRSLDSCIPSLENTGAYLIKTLKMYLHSGIGAVSSCGVRYHTSNYQVLHTIPTTGVVVDIHYPDLKVPVLCIGKPSTDFLSAR